MGDSFSDVLFKNATALEATSAINTVIFDKTGTLTEGKPALTDVIPADATENELLRFTAGVLLGPEWAALLMSASTVTVTLNALTLSGVRLSK